MEILEEILKKEQELLRQLDTLRSRKKYYKGLISVFETLEMKRERIQLKYDLQEGQIFDNPITGLGRITKVAIKQRKVGIYFIPENGSKEWFAEEGGMKFNAIIDSRFEQQNKNSKQLWKQD